MQSLKIVNSTNYIIKGEVTYITIFCTNHYFFVKPKAVWKSEKRGVCPIVEISAEVKTPRGIFNAKPYISIGTSHSSFEVVEIRENIFKILKMKNTDAKKDTIADIYRQSLMEQR